MVNVKNTFTFLAWRRVVWLHLPVHRINLLPPLWDVDNFLPDCTANSLVKHEIIRMCFLELTFVKIDSKICFSSTTIIINMRVCNDSIIMPPGNNTIAVNK